MVLYYMRKTTMPSYHNKHLQDAIDAIRGGQSMQHTSVEFGIPKRTLMWHCRGDVASPGLVQLGRPRALLDDALEKEI